MAGRDRRHVSYITIVLRLRLHMVTKATTRRITTRLWHMLQVIALLALDLDIQCAVVISKPDANRVFIAIDGN